ncbi:MAG: NADH-quinone oxidoreductase subunit H [Candidatus Vogelbacteria bacterium]|nr:NADH-quinone oxidoreductase subunit H [Candidatus Vogelbacteria bacterium]
MTILIWITQILLIPLVSPLFIGIIRKIKAEFQNRQGASIVQPYWDLWKLLHKDEIVTKDASFISFYAPFIIFAVTVVVGASIPLFASFLSNQLMSDMLVVIYTLSLATFFLALAGMDSGGGFGGFGASREMTVAALAEAGLIFSLLTIYFVSGTSNLFAMSSGILAMQANNYISVVLAFIGFFIILLAETGRFPFDNPATHLELTMIHEAMILEYSGKSLALIEWASANKFLIFASIGANVFFPWGIAQLVTIDAILIGTLAFMAKILFLCLLVAIIESSIAKLRFFRLPNLLAISFLFSALAIGLIH